MLRKRTRKTTLEKLPVIKSVILSFSVLCVDAEKVDQKSIAELTQCDCRLVNKISQALVSLGYLKDHGGMPKVFEWIGGKVDINDDLTVTVYRKMQDIRDQKRKQEKLDLLSILNTYPREEVMDAFRKYLSLSRK